MNLDAKITERQFRILELLSLGYAEKEIAEEMGVSVRTIDNTICRLKEKINVHKST
ncbi:MAG TPA: response regulator transcription factor, partial [Candidatus Gallibacteroides avistercoris]|nr:response regulator transcription factor [Candidatus Gallibacteroides avistercoris]